ncbi:MAG: glycosyltransferase family A protein [Dehalococcoidales bacterium]|nr:glycosyltransferase family A protein [Dehalococcoidales bacterium]
MKHTSERLPISVIVPTKNVEKTIITCLDSIRASNPAEIIVVDGKSTDATLEICARYTDKIYSDEGKGPSFAHLLGLEHATQEYIAFIDADIILPDGTLKTMLEELKSSDFVSMTARMIGYKLTNYWERATDWNNQAIQARRGGGLFATVLIKKIVQEYGFDPDIKPVGDDNDFQMRLQRGGHKMGTSKTFVYHQHRADMKRLYRWRFVYGRAIPAFIRKYGPWHISFYPPVTRGYWVILCIIKGKPQYIPYFILDAFAETAGMIKGFFELKRPKHNT